MPKSLKGARERAEVGGHRTAANSKLVQSRNQDGE